MAGQEGELRSPISWDRRIALMGELGDFSLYMERPFLWKVRHQGVLLVLDVTDDGVSFTYPEGADTNPYGAADEHWRLLTASSPYLLARNEVIRWNGEGWTTLGAFDGAGSVPR